MERECSSPYARDEVIPILIKKTIDRVLDIYLIPPPHRKKTKKGKTSRIESDSEDEELLYSGPDGLLPDAEDRVAVDEWEARAGRQLDEEDVDEIAGMVSWCLVKWDDLQYDQCTPPLRSLVFLVSSISGFGNS